MLDLNNPVVNQVWQHLQSAKNILLHCHYKADPDSVGSALAFMHALQGLGKNAVVIQGDSAFPPSLKILAGSDQVLPKSWSEIDLSEFDTFVILDSSNLEQITRKIPVVFPPHLKIIVIDHHQNNLLPSELKIVDENIVATAEVVYQLFKHWKVKITPEMAQCLLLAIYDDSGGFKYAKTTSNTFNAASELSSLYPDFSNMIFEVENDLTPRSIVYLTCALNNIRSYFDGRVSVAVVDNDFISQNAITQEDKEHIVMSNILISVRNCEIGVTITEMSSGSFDFSFRSRHPDEFDVSAIARSLGGGGHKVAAGATVKASSKEEVIQKLLSAISSLYPQLGTP
jgi:bifunctional oligoribonuclease and PAP phosphatase NrnA